MTKLEGMTNDQRTNGRRLVSFFIRPPRRSLVEGGCFGIERILDTRQKSSI
jgi:hypothetical protein